jgi:hypothetical protein
MAEANTNFFRMIIMTDEDILKLRTLLYGLKIRALNAQILSANSGSFAVSYGVVATEIIRFNEKIQGVNESLALSTAIVLKMASQMQKKTKSHQLVGLSIERSNQRLPDPATISTFKKRYQEQGSELEALESNMRKKFSDIHTLVRSSIKICLEGRTVSLQTRIESASIIENQKLFLAVAESFDSALNIIESSYRYLARLW